MSVPHCYCGPLQVLEVLAAFGPTPLPPPWSLLPRLPNPPHLWPSSIPLSLPPSSTTWHLIPTEHHHPPKPETIVPVLWPVASAFGETRLSLEPGPCSIRLTSFEIESTRTPGTSFNSDQFLFLGMFRVLSDVVRWTTTGCSGL
ncbi:hypothetical protein CC79DRAFT_193524 [Sarocladium strictum]